MKVQGIMDAFYLALPVQTDNHGLDRPPELCDFKCTD